jgi:Fur family transcriptional regulator, peroxide stress response regulator
MKLTYSHIKEKLLEAGLKITPQRMAILKAIYALNSHPTAENIIDSIKITHPNIATGTVYKILDALVENQIIKKVKTEKDVMRYDGIMENHHHLYCSDSDRIEDYIDKELNDILEKYFEKKVIPDFIIEDIKLQIIGKFINKKQ